MAKGYPAPRQPASDAVPALVPEGTCLICKRRPALQGGIKCEACARALAGP